MQLTQQIRIKPTLTQESVLRDLSEKNRLIYNFALQERKEAFKQGKKVSYLKQQNNLPKIKKQYPQYKWVYSKVLQYTLRALDANYKSFFSLWKKGDKQARPPKFKGKNHFFTMAFNQSGFKHEKGSINLSHKHPTKEKLNFKISKKFKFGKIYQVSLYEKDRNFYLSIIHEKQEKEYLDNGLYQAFDLGVTKHAAVNSKGKFVEFTNQRPDKYWEKPITQIQNRRDHCKKKSNKWHKLNNNLKRMARKSSNQLKDFQHKLSRRIIDNTKANTIILGKLEIKKLSRKNKFEKGLHKSMHNTGNISRFVRFLTYKARLEGKRVIEINERGTTITCSVCDEKQKMPLYKRRYECNCGNDMDRDQNSAVNIMNRFLLQNALWTGYQQFVGNMRHVQNFVLARQNIKCFERTANRKTKVSLLGLGGLA